MDEKRFEELWERAEAESYATKLSKEYPAWRKRRQRTMATAAIVLVMAGAALPMLSNPTQPTYDIACNRSGIADQYWVDVADQLLKEA